MQHSFCDTFFQENQAFSGENSKFSRENLQADHTFPSKLMYSILRLIVSEVFCTVLYFR